MCTVCGCGEGEVKLEGDGHSHPHTHGHAPGAHMRPRAHGRDPVRYRKSGDEGLHFGLGAAHAHAPGLTQGRMVQIEQDILGKNNVYAAQNRALLASRGIFAINLVSSPGSGKTTLLTRPSN